MLIKEAILQVNFETHVITDNTGMVLTLRDEVWEDLISKIDPFWHTESDRIEFFFYYNTGEYLCQKEKLVYDFSSKAKTWKTYLFTEGSEEKSKELYDFFSVYLFVEKDLKTEEFTAMMERIEAEEKYYNSLYAAKLDEKKTMLSKSDWRMLPDVQDENRDMWIKWREAVRNTEIKEASEFENNLEYFRYLLSIKYPIDPLIYLQKYPEKEVEYLATEDQFTQNSMDASSDMIKDNLVKLMNYLDGYTSIEHELEKSLYDLANQLNLKQVFPGLNLEKYTIVGE